VRLNIQRQENNFLEDFANMFHVCVGDQLLCEISRGMCMRVDRDEMEESSASSFERVGRPERFFCLHFVGLI
jgi:hypothetical protein